MTSARLSLREFEGEFDKLFKTLFDPPDIQRCNPIHSFILEFVHLVLNNYKNLNSNKMELDTENRFISLNNVNKFVIQMKKYSQIMRDYITNILIKKYHQSQFYPSDLIQMLHCLLLILSVHDPPLEDPSSLSFKQIIAQNKFLLNKFVAKNIDINHKHCFVIKEVNSNKLCRTISCGKYNQKYTDYINMVEEEKEYYSYSDKLSKQFCSKCNQMMIEHKRNYKSLSNSKPSIPFIHSKDIRYLLNRIIYKLYHIYAGKIVYGNDQIDIGHYHYYCITKDENINHYEEMKLLLLGVINPDARKYIYCYNYPNVFSESFQEMVKQLINSTMDGRKFLFNLQQSSMNVNFDTFDVCFNSKKHFDTYECKEINQMYNYVDKLPYNIENLTLIYEIKEKPIEKGYQFVNVNFYRNLDIYIPGQNISSLKNKIFFGPKGCSKSWYLQERYNDDDDDDDIEFEQIGETREYMICNEFEITERRININFSKKQQLYLQNMVTDWKQDSEDDRYKYEYRYEYYHYFEDIMRAQFYDTFEVQYKYQNNVYICSMYLTYDDEYPTRKSPFIQFDTRQIDWKCEPMHSKCIYFDLLFENNNNNNQIAHFLSDMNNIWNESCNNLNFSNIKQSFVVKLINKFKILCINIFTTEFENKDKDKPYLMMLSDDIFMYRIFPFLDFKYRDFKELSVGDSVLCEGIKIGGKIINIMRGQTVCDNKIVYIEVLFEQNLKYTSQALSSRFRGEITNDGWTIQISPDKIHKIEDCLPFVNTKFYLISSHNKRLSFCRLTIFGDLVIRHFWKSMTKYKTRINENDLTWFFTKIYGCIDSIRNINRFSSQRSKYLIKKYGYFDKNCGKHLMVFIQFYSMYILLCENETNRVWSEICLMDGQSIKQHANQSSPILRSTWKNKLNLRVINHEHDFERIWKISIVDIKLRYGIYCWNGKFLCRECITEHMEYRCCEKNKLIYQYILEILCEKYELLHENVIHLFKLLQWVLTNECDDNKWTKEFLF